MKDIFTLDNLNSLFPEEFSAQQKAEGKTLFLKELSLYMHKFYGGKMMSVPKAGLYGFNWFNVYYTPGVSKVSTTIRDDNNSSFELSNRGNLVAVVSDSTRVLGDGDCTPPGGLGVMEGKAFLMKYLGGIDAVSLCIDSKDKTGKNSADKIIDFVKMVQHSFGAINLEDISQPNCYKVLDVLREECSIPVWHDDAQGTGCVSVAGLLNALELAKKDIKAVRIVLLGAGSSNTTIARLLIKTGANPKNIMIFDSKGGLHTGRKDIENAPEYYPKWELCKTTNPDKVTTIEEGIEGADVLIALSKPGPDTLKPEWIKKMGKNPIVFVCANPVPEIYPHKAKEAGAFIVATGRGDFENQVNNSLGFPGILKGALTVMATKITDNMAISAAKAIALAAKDRGITPNSIVPLMSEWEVFPRVATAVAMQAIKDNVARKKISEAEVFKIVEKDIKQSRELIHHLMSSGHIIPPPRELIEKALNFAVDKIKNS
jgi:malate dehydrogenase (oxaloacetate-decarboxylating)